MQNFVFTISFLMFFFASCSREHELPEKALPRAVKLEIMLVSPQFPTVNAPFKIKIQAVDSIGNPQRVTDTTNVLIMDSNEPPTRNYGVQVTIPIGQSSVEYSWIKFSSATCNVNLKAEHLQASRDRKLNSSNSLRLTLQQCTPPSSETNIIGAWNGFDVSRGLAGSLGTVNFQPDGSGLSYRQNGLALFSAEVPDLSGVTSVSNRFHWSINGNIIQAVFFHPDSNVNTSISKYYRLRNNECNSLTLECSQSNCGIHIFHRDQ